MKASITLTTSSPVNPRTDNAHASTAARLRGALAAATTAITAVLGHGAAGGHAPTMQDTALLAVACLGLGLTAGSSTAFTRPIRLFAVLAAGQATCHVLFAATTPGHRMSLPLAMLLAHTLALLGTTMLIVLVDTAVHRLRHCARRIRGALTNVQQPPEGAPLLAPVTVGVRRVLACGVRGGLTRRGPPGGISCAADMIRFDLREETTYRCSTGFPGPACCWPPLLPS
uniref:Uncharacterized protein n=1 Tax=Rhodococcus sp. NS1 TaxID=402236 RepID=A0A097SPK5_9NOCA|nr:hypothetical protein LRS1606.18 [Rhodococcus sp. NS1]